MRNKYRIIDRNFGEYPVHCRVVKVVRIDRRTRVRGLRSYRDLDLDLDRGRTRL